MSTVVTLPYDPVWTALGWAKKNCPSYITNRLSANKYPGVIIIDVNYIDYYFGNEQDAIWFRLRWGGVPASYSS